MLKHARVAAALCSLTLSLFASAARAANLPITGQVNAEPGVSLFVDTDGNANIDAQALVQQFKDLFAGSQWTITKDGVLVNGKDGKPLFTASYISFADDNSFLIVHTRVGSTFVDGDFFVDEQDAKKAYLVLWLLAPSKDGKAFYSPRIVLQLALGGSTPTTPPTGGGFGNF